MTFYVPRPVPCPACKHGRVGMDCCKTCEGTGTVYKVRGKLFPDTREGYERAEREFLPPIA